MTRTMQYTGVLAVEICCNCGVSFAMPQDMQTRRLNDHRDFYCPAGHPQHYTGKTEEQRLRDRLRSAEASEQFYRDQAAFERRSAAAQKGHRTRVLNLISKGICPVAGCRRNFTNVRDHMAGEHPDFTVDGGEQS